MQNLNTAIILESHNLLLKVSKELFEKLIDSENQYLYHVAQILKNIYNICRKY